jgi:penicillin-binding protein 1B
MTGGTKRKGPRARFGPFCGWLPWRRARRRNKGGGRTVREPPSRILAFLFRRDGRGRRNGHWFSWPRALVALGALFLLYVVYLDYQVRHQFEGKRWSIPARVYARPLELYPGLQLDAEQFVNELAALRYRTVLSPRGTGEVARERRTFHLVSRPFVFWDGAESSHDMRVTFSNGRIATLTDARSDKPLGLVRLEPVMVGSFYPDHVEDRVLVRLDDVPPLLVSALVAIEDRGFYEHSGIAPTAILRALLANIRAGEVVQGGSTLTQQLVKNFYLSSRRTLWRKFNEAIMALLLEVHYGKDEILEAYLNEVYLAQDGARAIHGFGMASYHYFERPVAELSLEQLALLVALVKGPSYYNPERHPERALERRNLVLDVMAQQELIDAAQAGRARSRPLGVSPLRHRSVNAFPAFMDLVRRQLRRDYREEDLTSEGLRIFTTLDPQVQWTLEDVLDRRLDGLERQRGLPASTLEGAALVTGTESGEVLGLAGGRAARYAGFNRALDARRQVGSLIKPAVYLTALEQPRRYTLATLLDDSQLTYTAKNGDMWTPENYDRTNHGEIALYRALARSYNVATARLGLEIGAAPVIETLRRLGAGGDIPPYPSMFLGAVELSPIEVTQVYQTLASGGFRTPLRAIRAVLAADGTPLQRFPLRVEPVVGPAPVYLLTTALQSVVREGTAHALEQIVPASLNVAGKTGTTNGLRDSWFAGFTGDRLAVVWVGRDDNASTGLTGSSGALRVWGDLFRRTGSQPLEPLNPEDIEWMTIDPSSGLLADEGCTDAVQLPFITGSEPAAHAACAGRHMPVQRSIEKSINWFRELFE